ncbi:hypothetical protein [Agrobacterium tumefaciens]|uniref:hypothetical protein n=1 Tax=Agrobacterium tumefaciens TaxID=358 RepID=UPI0015742D23|nr:hypothetical protein [Agrobacterium tumefaciens]NTA45357.1 hypothetical protein [Agrobacterium tumefaciens]UXU08321.1 hypothetical protein FY128_23045 [Agrobacterium tumefaciens]WIE36017.1 hypothetical protein G6L82_023135 [Agrobacterium tumefaciens]
MPEFKNILYMVVALIALSAFMAAGLSVLGAFFPIPFSEALVKAFIECFKAGLAGLMGLLVGATSRPDQKAP